VSPPLPTTATAIARDVAARKCTAEEVARFHLDRIALLGARLGAFLSVDPDQTLAEARAVDARAAKGEPMALAGVPIAVKDNICAVGWRATCGSRILENFRPPYDATATERFRAAGAVIVGKTNMDEFAMGSSTENSAFYPARNPWDLERTPGGSSGGSAVAVSAGLAAVALGSDTGGSVRQPAALTGVVGLKPTYGRVSRYGLVAFGSSLDQIGPFGRNVEDAARIFDVIAGPDPRDATCALAPAQQAVAGLREGVRGLKVGLPEEYFGDAVDAPVREAVMAAARALEKAGATLVKVRLPHTPYAIPTYYIVATAEASSNLARYDGVHYGHRAEGAPDIEKLFAESRREGFGREVRRRILLGTFCLSSGYHDAYYDRALRVRSLLKQDFDEAFKICDVLIGPTSPTPAFKLGERVADPLKMYVSDILTGALNLAGVPGLVVPCGTVAAGGQELPVGAQLIGPYFSEALLFRAGQVVEDALWTPTRVPPAAKEAAA
jgi:aspartyl-tRNA(Asn)/glutamyl-tRNA(Gln) amidotransferase subunit A